MDHATFQLYTLQQQQQSIPMPRQNHRDQRNQQETCKSMDVGSLGSSQDYHLMGVTPAQSHIVMHPYHNLQLGSQQSANFVVPDSSHVNVVDEMNPFYHEGFSDSVEDLNTVSTADQRRLCVGSVKVSVEAKGNNNLDLFHSSSQQTSFTPVSKTIMSSKLIINGPASTASTNPRQVNSSRGLKS